MRTIILVLVTFFLISTAGYFWWQNQQFPQNQPPTRQQETSTSSDWKIFRDDDYKITFKYPSNWLASVTKISNTDVDKQNVPPWSVAGVIINFNYSDLETGLQQIEISRTSDYSRNQFEGYINNIKKLERVYQTKTPLADDAFELPAENAALLGYSFPKYIQNTDGSWRGLYFYAKIAQNVVDQLGNNNPARLFDLIVILTNGKGGIFQIWASAPIGILENPSAFENWPEKCNDLERKLDKCQVATSLKQDFETKYQQIAQSIEDL